MSNSKPKTNKQDKAISAQPPEPAAQMEKFNNAIRKILSVPKKNIPKK